MKRIGELIHLPEIKTVVHLKDALGPEGKSLQTELVLTNEVSRAFQAIYYSLAEERGKGFFIEGGYGSGKSHFLACLFLYLSTSTSPPLLDLPQPKGPWLVVPISLLDYSSEVRLQEIVLEAINTALQKKWGMGFIGSEFLTSLKTLLAPYQDKIATLAARLDVSEEELFTLAYWPYLNTLLQELNLPYRPVLERGRLFKHLQTVLSEKGIKGVVLLIDELSEFLKSKPSVAAFQEDIRFLQFLGEVAPETPLWIIASLQEKIETTGDIPQDAFAKIKDRYPVRLGFAGAHIEEIISERLVKKLRGARGYLQELYAQFQQTFNYLPFDWEQWFKLYPVHPMTIRLLDELRGLFSQHRGAVDFVYSRLKGDPKRHIPSLLDAPAQTLLSPTVIFDHFLDRIRETLETNPYYEKVYRLYEQLMPKLFPDPDTRQVGFRLIKLLILLAISPIQHRPTTKDLTLALLYPFTDLDSSLNYRFIHDILSLLSQQGAYLRHEKGEQFLEDRFYLDLEEDAQLLIRTRFQHLKQELSPKDTRVYNFIYESSRCLIPFEELSRSEAMEVNLIWQNTRRHGRIYFVSSEEFHSRLQEITSASPDFHLFILRLPLKEDFIPPDLPVAVGIWEPGEIDEEILQKAYIYGQLLKRYHQDTSPRGQKLKKILEEFYQDSLKQAGQELLWAYRQGNLYLCGKEKAQVAVFDQTNWQRLLANMAALILEKRYPLHHLIAPHTLPPPLFQRQQLVDALIVPGEITLKRGERAFKMLIEGLLRPLGLLKKTPGGYRLVIEGARSPLLKHVLEAFDHQPLWETKVLFKSLRFGEFGLCEEQYELLLLTLIHSGLLTAYHQGKRMVATRVNLAMLDKIDTLERTQSLSKDEISLLTTLPFLPEKFKAEELTVTQQEGVWQFLKRFKEEYLPRAQALKAFFQKYASHPLFTQDAVTLAQETIQNFLTLLDGIKTSLPQVEGLKRFCAVLKDIPFLDMLYARLQALFNFYEKREQVLFIYEYLHHPDLSLPAEYQDLAVLCGAARAIIAKENLLFQPAAIVALEEKFGQFFEAYSQVYLKKHQDCFDPRYFDSYFTIRQEEDYKLLKAWATLPVLPARAFLEKVETELNRILKQRCRADTVACLKSAPVCACGWRLGELLYLPPLAEIKAILQEGIEACLQVLKHPPLRTQLENYIQGLQEIGAKQEAKEMTNLLRGKGKTKDLLRLTPALKKALLQGIKIVERNLDTLITRLKGQSLTKAQLEAILKEWIEGKEGVGADVYIKITASSSGIPPVLELVLQESDPTFFPLAQKWRERFFMLLLYIAWCHFQGLPITLAADLAGLPETEWHDKQASLLKVALRLTEENAFKEWAEGIEDEDVLWQHLRLYQPDLSVAFRREKLFPGLKSRLLATLLETGAEVELEGLEEETKRLVKSYKRLLSLSSLPLPTLFKRSEWEEFYTKDLARMEWDLGVVLASALPHTTKQTLVKTVVKWRKELDKAFIPFYQQQKHLPLRLPAQGIAILLDGLRWDLWLFFKQHLWPVLGYQVKQEGTYWVNTPTDTFTQLTALGLDTYFENISHGLHLLKRGKLKVFKLDVIDNYLHSSHLFPHQLATEIISQLKRLLKPLLKGTKNVFILSDHGFRMNLHVALQPSYHKDLYTHGKISPEEVIVPWAVVERKVGLTK